MDKEEKTTTQEKMDIGTDNNQQEGEDCKECQKIYFGQLSNEESDISSDFWDLWLTRTFSECAFNLSVEKC